MFGPYTLVSVLTLGVYFLGVLGDHFTTGYITSSPGGGKELSPLYRLLKDRLTIHQFVDLSSVIKAVGGVFFFIVVPSMIVLPALLVCTAPTFNMFWLWKSQRVIASPSKDSRPLDYPKGRWEATDATDSSLARGLGSTEDLRGRELQRG